MIDPINSIQYNINLRQCIRSFHYSGNNLMKKEYNSIRKLTYLITRIDTLRLRKWSVPTKKRAHPIEMRSSVYYFRLLILLGK